MYQFFNLGYFLKSIHFEAFILKGHRLKGETIV